MTIKITSQDVAKLAGVSQSAVSRVFTPGASASAKMVSRVQVAANQLGYRPNIIARSLITGKSRMIGFIVAYLNNQFYPDSLQKLSERLQQEGYHVLIFIVENNSQTIRKTVQKLLDYQVDGIVAASVSLASGLAEACGNAGVPLTLYNRSDIGNNVSYVTSNNYQGGIKVANHFAEIGIKRPAYIAGWEGSSTQRDRERGFVEGLSKHGLTLFRRGVGNYTLEGAQQATREIFEAKSRPDGVFVANDHMAFAVMDVLRSELGLRIPEDVCVAGYDDVEIASWPSYSLTSVQQPTQKMATATVDALLDAINDPHKPIVQLQIDGHLVVRNSTTKNKNEKF